MDTQLIADRLEIMDLYSRYARLSELGDYARWAAECFVKGGVFDGGYDRYVLPDEVDRMTANSGKIKDAWGTIRHAITCIESDVDGDRATSSCFFQTIATKTGGTPQIVESGTYRDELEKVDGQWLFRTRNITLDGFEGYGVPPEKG